MLDLVSDLFWPSFFDLFCGCKLVLLSLDCTDLSFFILSLPAETSLLFCPADFKVLSFILHIAPIKTIHITIITPIKISFYFHVFTATKIIAVFTFFLSYF
jgi:hypothetical protein